MVSTTANYTRLLAGLLLFYAIWAAADGFGKLATPVTPSRPLATAGILCLLSRRWSV